MRWIQRSAVEDVPAEMTAEIALRHAGHERRIARQFRPSPLPGPLERVVRQPAGRDPHLAAVGQSGEDVRGDSFPLGVPAGANRFPAHPFGLQVGLVLFVRELPESVPATPAAPVEAPHPAALELAAHDLDHEVRALEQLGPPPPRRLLVGQLERPADAEAGVAPGELGVLGQDATGEVTGGPSLRPTALSPSGSREPASRGPRRPLA
jgi:hypothetical protein